MSWSQDILCVIRGLQSVAQAGIKLQETNLKVVWNNSSIRTAADDIINKTKNPENFTFDEISKNLNETGGRIYTVLHGVKEFATYTSSVKVNKFTDSPRQVSNVKTEHKAEKSKTELEIKLTESDKKLLKKLDMEYQQKLKASALKQEIKDGTVPKQKVEGSINIKEREVDQSDLKQVKAHKPEVPVVQNVKDIPKVTAVPNPKSRLTLNPSSKQRTVPASRIGRMVSFGSLAAGLGIGTVAEYARRTFGFGNESNMFLTQANMDRIVDTLCKVRGAALKIGQIMSIQDESVINPELAKALERVRKSADFMPKWQIENVMQNELGDDWRLFFSEFEDKPFAAASIGQVHWAKTRDGQPVAIKIQYPGVAKGIESDIDNLVAIMKVWDVFPKGMFIDNIVSVAKRELAWEVDYIREAECTRKFKRLLAPYPEYYVPKVIDHLCTSQVFTTEYVEGIPVDQCLNLAEEPKKFIAKTTMVLCLLELIEFHYMQTDPNWANFLYDPEKKRLVLLDFGASREYSKPFLDKYIRIIKAASDNDRESVQNLSKELGFLTGYESKIMIDTHVDTVMLLGEMFRHPGEFNFSAHDLSRKVQNMVPTMLAHRLCPPPEEIYSLHRKLSGVFLLCSKLKVSIAMRDKFLDLYNKYKFDDVK